MVVVVVFIVVVFVVVVFVVVVFVVVFFDVIVFVVIVFIVVVLMGNGRFQKWPKRMMMKESSVYLDTGKRQIETEDGMC